MKYITSKLLALTISATVAFACTTLSASEQKKLNGNEIKEFLSDHFVKGSYKGREWISFFNVNGDTHYTEGNNRPSNGVWKVEGDRYCSQWPPSASWGCYFVTVNGNELTFVPEGGGDSWPGIRVVD